MASAQDQTVYLGSAVDHPLEVPKQDASVEKVKQIKETRKTRAANLKAGANELLKLLDAQIAKEDKMSFLRAETVQLVKNGQRVGDAMSDKLVYEAGRIDAFNEVRALLLKASGGKSNG